MGLGEYLVGAAVVLVEGAAAAGAAWLIVGRWLRDAPASVFALATAIVASALLVELHVALLALGILGQATAPIVVVAVCGALAWCFRGAPRRLGLPGLRGITLAHALAAVAAIGVLVAAGAVLLRGSGEYVSGYDAVVFHLPGSARWIQSGSLWELNGFVPFAGHATYPNHGNVLQLMVALPFESVFLARHVLVGFLALAALAIYAGARELGASRAAAVTSAAAFAAVPQVFTPAVSESYVDVACLAWFAAGVVFLLRHPRTGGRFGLVLAGVSLGLAFGTKWYAVLYVPAVIGLWGLLRPTAARAAQAVRDTALVSAVAGASGGIWLVRNWVEAGNPLYPAGIGLLGFDAAFDPNRAATGWSLAHYFGDGGAWTRYILPDLLDAFSPLGPVLLVGAAAAVVFARRSEAPRPIVFMIVAALAVLLLYPFIPFTALGPEGRPELTGVNARYAMPAFALAAMLTAVAIARAGRWALPAQGILVALTLYAVRDAGHPAVRDMAVVFVVLAVLSAAALGLARLLRPLVPASLATVLLVAAGLLLERRTPPDTRDPVVAYFAGGDAELQVGIAGDVAADQAPPVLQAFGPRLANGVEYVGPTVEHWIGRYRDRASFVRALRAGDYDALVILGMNPKEAEWARSAGYRPAVRAARRILMLR